MHGVETISVTEDENRRDIFKGQILIFLCPLTLAICVSIFHCGFAEATAVCDGYTLSPFEIGLKQAFRPWREGDILHILPSMAP
jgi:cadmium resistance protein CadD (predicted permease)